MNNTLLLIDGSSFIFRAYHAMPELTSPHGTPTGATYGIINMLKQMQKKYPTSHWGCVFDTDGETFRDKLHDQYKANRAAMPNDLVVQLEDIYGIIKALGIPIIMQRGVEADDIIGTLALTAKQAGKKVIIATSDKDFAQLVDSNITLINTMTNEVLDSNGVFNKFGVRPSQIIDYLALVGDAIDNIPGVDKCGPKTAAKWLAQYGNLDNIIAASQELSGVVGENLRQSIPWLTTAKILVTIHTTLDLTSILPLGLDSLVCTKPNEQALHDYYTKLGFKTWLRQLAPANTLALSTEPNLITNHLPLVNDKPKVMITSKQQLNKLVNSLIDKNETLALLVVADNPQTPTRLKLVFISTLTTTYILANLVDNYDTDLFNHNPNTLNYQEELLRLFASNNAKILLNYKETLQLLTRFNFPLHQVIGDVTLAHYLANSKQNHALSSIYQEYFKVEVIDLPQLNGKLSKDSLWQGNHTQQMLDNCSILIDQVINLEQKIRQSLDLAELKLYREVELPLVPILVAIENAGIKIDLAQFKNLEQDLSKRLFTLENEIFAQTQCVFNINSAKQLQEVLFNQLKLPVAGIKKNLSGYSTDEESLKTLEGQGISIASLLLEYRTLSKLLNTYVTKLPKLVDVNDKVHTTFEQALVASGRLSSRDPNLQNIPVRNEWGRRIRQCFIAEKGSMLICADYSQIELRILAHLSGDENLIQAFNTNQDIHSITASEIFNKPINQVTKDDRRYAKIINFSLLYGKTAYGLAQELGIDRLTAKNYIDAYFAKYPKIKACLEHIKSIARNNGYVSTVFGRKIYLPNINSNNKIIREAEERLALNAPMQGTSADIIKIAMVNLNQWLKSHSLQSQVILQIHDELILQVPNTEVEIIQTNLAWLMTQGIDLKVKLTVEIKLAHNWDEAH